MNALAQRAYLLIEQRRYEQAQQLLGQALGADPDDGWAHALMGMCLSGQDRHADAARVVQRAVTLEPDSQPIRVIAAQIALERDALPDARRLASEAIAMDPTDDRAYIVRAAVYAERRRWTECLLDAEQALAIDPESNGALNLRALANRGLGRSDRTATDFHAALANDPENPYTHANTGWAKLEAGDLGAAETHFREALRLEPSLETARVGVLETTKARFPAYRWFLSVMLRIARLSAGKQFALFFGLWIGMRVLGQLTAAAENPWLALAFLPVLVGYIAFCVASWFARGVSNAALMLHPFARLALTRQEKLEAFVVAGGFLLCIGLFIGSFWIEACSLLLLAALGPILAVVFSCQASHPTPRRWLRLAAVALAVNGLIVVWLNLRGEPPAGNTTWTEAWLRPRSEGILRFSPLGVILGAQLLLSQNWQRD